MGRGRSGSTAGVTKLTGTDGKPIYLDTPLVYGGDDTALSGTIRSVIEDFESKRYRNKVEFARVVDENGRVIEERRGGRGSVGISVRAANAGKVLSHNHPRSGGLLGGTFSVEDISGFVRADLSIYRATAAEGTYSIAKGRNFNFHGLLEYYKQAHKENFAKYQEATKDSNDSYNAVSKAYRKGEKTYAEVMTAYDKAVEVNNKAFNQFLVANHNALRDGQKKYGYTYTLERRK